METRQLARVLLASSASGPVARDTLGTRPIPSQATLSSWRAANSRCVRVLACVPDQALSSLRTTHKPLAHLDFGDGNAAGCCQEVASLWFAAYTTAPDQDCAYATHELSGRRERADTHQSTSSSGSGPGVAGSAFRRQRSRAQGLSPSAVERSDVQPRRTANRICCLLSCTRTPARNGRTVSLSQIHCTAFRFVVQGE